MSLYNDASLVMVPSGYKDGTLYSAKPTNGDGDFTFSRGSNLAATRVNSEGLIEKGRENLFTYSNDFSNAVWDYTTNGLTRTASSIIDPNGGTNAWEITTTATNEHHRLGHIITSGQVKTFSFYAKANGYEYVRVWAFSGGNTGTNYFHLSDEGTAIANGQLGIASIESVGNGWYRCQGVLDPVNSSAVVISPAPDANTAASTATYLADGTSGIYLFQAQLEAGLVATDYIETGASTAQAGILEDMPRLDYSGGASCPSLLLEPQRSNLVTQSEYIDSFTKTRCTITQNSLVSPEGLNNAAKITQTTSTAWGGIVSTYAPSSPSTLSVFAKKIDNDFIAVIGHNSNDTKAYFNLANGTVGTIGTDATSASIEDFGNGWYRCIMTATTVNRYTILHSTTDGGSTAPIDSETALWGCQLESSASYVSSYIPTYGSSVTRSQDVCSKTGISSLIGQTEGTLFAKCSALADDATNRRIALSDGTTSNSMYISYKNYTNQLRVEVISAGSSVFDFTYPVADITQTIKMAIAYKLNDFAFYVDGTQVATDTSGAVPSSLSQLKFDNGAGGSNFYGKVNQAILFPTRLSNDELADLTTI